MKDPKYSDSKIILTQSIAWYAALVMFAIVAVMFVFNLPYALTAAKAGVIVMIALTIFKIIVMAIKFKKIGMNRLVLLSYILIMILLSTVLIKYFL